MDCPICKGTGRLSERLCPACKGTGKVIAKSNLEEGIENATEELGKTQRQEAKAERQR